MVIGLTVSVGQLANGIVLDAATIGDDRTELLEEEPGAVLVEGAGTKGDNDVSGCIVPWRDPVFGKRRRQVLGGMV